MKLSIWVFIKGQFAKQLPVAKADLTGKTVIVLGANTGLGFEAAKHFARMGAGRLIMACRSQSRGQAALHKLKAETGSQNSELWIIDRADFASVKRFAHKFEQDGGRLDILVENAAITSTKYEATKDGWEATASAKGATFSPLSAIVVVTSELHYLSEIPKSVCEGGDILTTLGSAAYCTPKTMQSYYMLTKPSCSFALWPSASGAPRSSSPLSTQASVSLSSAATFSGVMWLVTSIMERILAFPTEVGSRQLVWGAVGRPENPDALRGAYTNQCQVEEPSDFAISPEGQKAQDRIWDELVEMLGKLDPRVLATVEEYLAPAA
ncbi:hypothetical protein FB451DRAFT_1483757 [Mycena latifolia]|nr:hypothetical protein FB451DRAFT_1483757 [Mycena latifolia]